MAARCRGCDEAVGALRIARRMSHWGPVIVTLAILPGRARASLRVAKLVNPGDSRSRIKLMASRSGIVGLGHSAVGQLRGFALPACSGLPRIGPSDPCGDWPRIQDVESPLDSRT